MFLLGEHVASVEGLLEYVNSSARSLQRLLPPSPNNLELYPGTDLFRRVPRGHLCLVRRGMLSAVMDNRVAYILQPGDVAGIEGGIKAATVSYVCEDPVELDCFSPVAFQELMKENQQLSNTWQSYVVGLMTLFSHSYGDISKEQHRPQAGFTRYKPGDVIIRQGEEADNVYTMMMGDAKVFIDDQEVGEVHEGEIFGAIAALTNAPRNATVVAGNSCTVMAVPKSQFVSLIHAHPETCFHLLENMARTINDLNRRLTGDSAAL
ncbi:cyclic nucleotide-binding domain-containing protein [Hahella sp. HN01]|uniref:cyclic nucleotide-binding domain-containing protein n=1 Tax=Hahella sp. HN01 TaxID=2847262 RepID=UPI001C1E9D20|nr:cyclic nucleotide-binding domain-containing protein [Hahella sp. HN01]MBU6955433.1 cyclic nucleotide-binding domain-containing protein [Hahella sp. HN01]